MRKDVLIARITFIILCLAIVGIIVSVVARVSGNHKSKPDKEQQEEQMSESSETDTESETMDTEMVQVPEEPIAVYVKTTKSVNLRSAANTDADVMKVLEAGEKLELVSESDGWAEVLVGGETGYVSMDFVEYVTEEDPVVDPVTGSSTVLKTTTDPVRMRTGAGTDFDILMTIESGVTLEIIEEVDGWAKVNYQGQTGFVSGDYLE